MSAPAAPGAPGGDDSTTAHRSIALDDVVAGALFIVLGLAFSIGALGYDVGTAFKMGPGYVPLVLAAVLTALGAGLVGTGLIQRDRPEDEAADAPGDVPWRAIVLITAAVLIFGAGIEPLGIVPILLITTFVAAIADRRTSLRDAALIAIGLTVLCVLVFVVLLQLRLP
ncbi:MAG TPA: tripartite tricarboxylate transporter TctB family protein, partial [Acidimicrobiia bacterium]|nr:tripartite tricarboxylate transporter TctB family protein [Acidimicrobiia bacterium]